MTSDEVFRFVVGAVVLVVVAGLFACLEAALARISRPRVEELVRTGRRGAGRLLTVVRDPARYLNLALLIRVACEVSAAVLITVVFLDGFDSRWQAVLASIGVMVVVSYVVVGVSPRTIGRQHPVAVGIAGAPVLVVLARILGPLPPLLILIGNAVTPGKGYREGPFASEAELRAFVDLAEKESLIEDEERKLLHSVLELGDTIVREVMVPRPDMVFIERHKTVRQALRLALRSGYSRIPVIGENEDDVVGIVYLKDLAAHAAGGTDDRWAHERVDTVMRRATFVPDSKPADDLLRELQASRTHMVIVVDEYGGTAGLVTIEDILEEIVGEITDEYDRETTPVEDLGDGRFRVTARLPIDDLGDLFGIELDDEDVETVAGLLAKQLGRVPIPGAAAEVEGLRLVADRPSGRRNQVGTIVVERAAPAEGDDEDADNEHGHG
ncbi:hemolysin family protein [Yinghuangia seranimata]|uniref:hemolysin family protein n=1 Tax=Yinghuangia seranimata TaxID=408067 RepID=UPI00248C1885|nr:hemolysin family protein [Yinghuangia seranimata]MDI2127477.1 hemolysin family protein [Yinghuangia seranimata]